ncbi:hypothetical protein LC593_10540 [Nostoc sp. CHAB 5844]|nr:hypothetical protein [Nostoc sp. CHAB 5844]
MSTACGRRILGICHQTWKRWEELALTIPEYELQLLKLNKMASKKGAAAPIVPYQVWVIGKIGEIYQLLPDGLPKKWMAEEYLNAKKDEFTRIAYQQEQERYSSMALEKA